jgi:hypothetical protein
VWPEQSTSMGSTPRQASRERQSTKPRTRILERIRIHLSAHNLLLFLNDLHIAVRVDLSSVG